MRPSLPPAPFLYPLTDRERGGDGPGALAEQLFGGGAAIVQLRDKGLADGAYLREARRAVAAARRASALLVVNDRVDAALLAGAQGIHVGDEDLPVADVRRLVGPAILLGQSTHSLDEALRAADGPVDYVALGPIFPSPSKSGRDPLGSEAIRQVKARSPKPVVAIGGIDGERLEEVLEAGADGVAVISAVMRPGAVSAATRALVAALAARPRR